MRQGKLAQAAARLMAGRYGADQYNRFLAICSAALLLLSLLLKKASETVSNALFVLAILLLVWCYTRLLSRNIDRRQEEARKYLEIEGGIRSWFRLQKDRFRQRREYAFFRCPGCKQTIRVPKGKGRIRITCRRCGFMFEKKT